jgi:uncharacterized membrane protein YagU involved in acid resistance
MSAIASQPLDTRKSLLRPIAMGGIMIAIAQLIHQWIVVSVLGEIPFILILQYIASGALGDAAFEGGSSTAVIGLIFHLLLSFAIAGVFILSADRILLLRRYPISSALLYGFGVWIVMNLIVTPLSATPPIDAPTTPQIIESIVEHMLVIGLTVGMLVRRNATHNE